MKKPPATPTPADAREALAAIMATCAYYIGADRDGVLFDNVRDPIKVFRQLRRVAANALDQEPPVYVVERESGDGPETDVFTSYELATKWAGLVGSTVREEPVIDADTLDLMVASRTDTADDA